MTTLDIERVLADEGMVEFRARGTCMYPAVRHGDLLRIRSCSTTSISPGDIAVCRKTGYLFSHRVTGKGNLGGRGYLVTRPDRSRHGSDQPVFDDNLLGVVVSVIRDGKTVDHSAVAHAWPIRGYFEARAGMKDSFLHLQAGLADALARLSSTPLYRMFARTWIALSQPHFSYSVRVPFNAGLNDSVYHSFEPDTFDVRMKLRGRNIYRWTLMLHLNGGSEPAVRMSFFHSSSGWRLDESFVRLRFRGTGLERAILEKAREIIDG